MADVVVIRHLAPSSLYKEDVCTGGHATVWGSYFNATTKRWGYKCCGSVVRDEPCRLRKESASNTALGSDDEIDEQTKAARSEWYAQRLLDADPPAVLGPRNEFQSSEAYLGQFVLYWFHAWVTSTSGEKPDDKSIKQTREALTPLLQQLKHKSVPSQLLESLASFAQLSAEREYSKANDVYVGITIGKALWHSHLDLGEQRAHWGQGCSLRTMQRQVVEKDVKNASLFDTDPTVQRYVHALKRLVTYMQSVQPSADPSKQGHVPAPTPDASEVGLPVLRDVRASDGRQREPEYVEPMEAQSIAVNRGIMFGERADRSHPFTGIGHARGI